MTNINYLDNQLDDFEVFVADGTEYEYMSSLNKNREYEKSLLGIVFGQAVADALGAPFEFGPPNQYEQAFGDKPVMTGTGEMIGGGAFRWRPGEFTDDTQMALIGIEALIDNFPELSQMYRTGDVDLSHFLQDLYGRYKAWARTAADVGSTTRGSLSHDDWSVGAKIQHERTGFSASNGCVMRLGPMVSAFISNLGDVASLTDVLDFAEAQTRLTHWDRQAVDASRLMAWIMYDILDVVWRNDGIASGYETVSLERIVDRLRSEFDSDELDMVFNFRDRNAVLNGPTNGKAITCLAQAIWAIHSTTSFEKAIIAAINIGGDTDTVAAVTGAIAGALYGVDAIPARWVTHVNGEIPGTVYGHMDYEGLNRLVHDRILNTDPDVLTRLDPPAGPKRLDAGVELYAANLPGIAEADDDSFHLISLCRTGGMTSGFQNRRNFFIIDTPGANPHLDLTVEEALDTIDAWLDKGQKVVVHCHAGRSRTGFILKAWYMRKHDVSHAEAHRWLHARWPHYDQFGNMDFTNFLDDFNSVPF